MGCSSFCAGWNEKHGNQRGGNERRGYDIEFMDYEGERNAFQLAVQLAYFASSGIMRCILRKGEHSGGTDRTMMGVHGHMACRLPSGMLATIHRSWNTRVDLITTIAPYHTATPSSRAGISSLSIIISACKKSIPLISIFSC